MSWANQQVYKIYGQNHINRVLQFAKPQNSKFRNFSFTEGIDLKFSTDFGYYNIFWCHLFGGCSLTVVISKKIPIKEDLRAWDQVKNQNFCFSSVIV